MGIISNAIDPSTAGKNVLSAGTTDWNATTGTVDPGTQTVAGQLHTLLASGSPYIEQAKAGALDTANSRGLLNSSMAAGAGEAAGIAAGLPIAQQDASTYSTQSLTNQAAKNAAGQFNAGAANTADLTAAGAANASLAATQAGNIQTGLIGKQAEETRATQAAGAEQAQTLAAQQGDINKQIATLQAQLQTGLIGATGAQTRMTNEQLAQAQKDLATLQATQASTLSAQQATQAQTLAAQQATAAKELQAAHDTVLQAMQTADAASKKEIENIDADYKTLMQSTQSAADLYKTSTAAITSVMQDPNMDAASKQTALDNQIAMLKSGLNLIGSVNGIDLSTLLPP